MITAVDSVTDHAVFLYRRMIPHKGTALVHVALIAKVIYRIGFYHSGCRRAMRVVAIRARNFSLSDRMVRLLVHLEVGAPVAVKTELGLTGLKILGSAHMGRMAAVAGNTG